MGKIAIHFRDAKNCKLRWMPKSANPLFFWRLCFLRDAFRRSPVIDGGVDEEFVAEGFTAEENAVDHTLAADEGDDDLFLYAGEEKGGLDENAVGGVACGGSDTFAYFDFLLKGDEFSFLTVEPDGEADAVAGKLDDLGAVNGGAFCSRIGLCFEPQGPFRKLHPLPPADGHAHGVGSSGLAGLGSFFIFLRFFFFAGMRPFMCSDFP